MNSDGRIVIYSRKSKFTGKGESIENQIEMCRQYIRIQFGTAAADNALVFEDEGFSGGTLDRPQFKKMMAEAGKNKFRAIVVYRLDRISRNIGDFSRLIEQFNGMKIDFISIKEQFDTSSPMGRAMMYISSVFSQLERETIAERIRDNMHELAKTGRWLGGVTPTGYESENISSLTVGGKLKKACKLNIIPEEIRIVRLIFDKFLETGSLTQTETYLLQNRCTTKNGKQFTRFTVKGILSNPVYLIADEFAWQYLTEHHADLFSDRSEFDGVHGIMAYNRTLQQIEELHGKGEGLKKRLAGLKDLTSSPALSDMEFGLLAQILSSFEPTADAMTVEQKRAAIRTLVKEIIWDGTDAHVVLFGSDYSYEFPDAPADGDVFPQEQ